ncbi:hypothetical protein [uncultured Arthrobacter sp.]|uniref:hypothetical protein n=1 Tax=uncultured Arthrobacter sp. TaxID=114050 RepID=UPI0028D758C8|nr:hypothetical protein [uncultured Arthrobacter sp.]
MKTQTTEHVDAARISWPAPVPISAERVITGEPVASTLVLEETPTHQLGLWQVSPGEFVTDHAGYVEYIQSRGCAPPGASSSRAA